MKLIIHKLHVFSILTTTPSFINYQLKKKNCSMQSGNFATHVIEAGIDIFYIQQLLGHLRIKTTMIYGHITNKAINRIQCPVDRLNLNTENKSDEKITKKYNTSV